MSRLVLSTADHESLYIMAGRKEWDHTYCTTQMKGMGSFPRQLWVELSAVPRAGTNIGSASMEYPHSPMEGRSRLSSAATLSPCPSRAAGVCPAQLCLRTQIGLCAQTGVGACRSSPGSLAVMGGDILLYTRRGQGCLFNTGDVAQSSL